MMKCAALVTVVSSLVWACSAGEAEEAETSTADATAGSMIEAVFGGVQLDEPKCFERSYSNDHLARHPKQTVSAIRVALAKGEPDSSFQPEHAAKVTFTQKTSTGPKIRDLSCELVNGKVRCTEERTCTSSVELTATGTGLRMTNKDLRSSGACDVSPKPLDATPGADDVFDLVPVACSAGTLANPPTVDCSVVLQPVRACIDIMPLAGCVPESVIKKGTRYTDEVQMSEVEGRRLESAEECIQRFTDIVAVDGCCGG